MVRCPFLFLFFECDTSDHYSDHHMPHLPQVEPGKSDAWSKYMAEVKKYKAHQCGDDDKTRPLVK